MTKGKSRNRQHRRMKCRAIINPTLSKHLKVRGGKSSYVMLKQVERPLLVNPYTNRARSDRFARNVQ